MAWRASRVLNSERPHSSWFRSFSSSTACSSLFNEAQKTSFCRKLCLIKRNRPPAEYWVNEYLLLWLWIAVLECEMHADGMRIVEPGGKVTMSPHSQRMMWLLAAGSNSLRAVIEQQPNTRLLESKCRKQAIFGPKFTVVAAQGLLGKFGWR